MIRRGVSFRFLVVVPFCIALIVQLVLCIGVLTANRTLPTMRNDAYNLLTERVRASANYVENDMVYRWSSFDQTAAQVEDSITDVLEERGAQTSDLHTGSDLSLQVINATADSLVSFARASSVDGVFLLLVDSPTTDTHGKGSLTSFYLRDSSPDVVVENGADLMLAACPIGVAKRLGLALDSSWSATFPLAAEGEDASDFYYEPLRAGMKYGNVDNSSLGYWGEPVNLGWSGSRSVTYSLPLHDARGAVVGVMGVEVDIDRITSLFPNGESSVGSSNSFMLVKTDETTGYSWKDGIFPHGPDPRSYEVLTAAGAIQNLYVEDDILKVGETGSGFFAADPLDEALSRQEGIVALSSLELYDATSPWSGEHWALVGLVPEDDLFAASGDLARNLTTVFVSSLIIGFVVAAVLAAMSSARLRALMRQMKETPRDKPVVFSSTGIIEVDQLADAVETLSAEVAETRRKAEHERDHDLLTGLLSRRAFERTVRERLQGGSCGTAVMVMFDLDNLKYANDSFGHDWGDRYIKAAGSALSGAFGGRGWCSRVSGDEFLAFAEEAETGSVELLIEDLRQALNATTIAAPDGSILKVRASMGAARYPDDAGNYDDLREYADFAMYEVKNNRKGDLRWFDRDSYEEHSFLLRTKEDLNRLFDEHLIAYYFQPIVNARTGEVFGYEALMRPQIPSIPSVDRVLKLARSQSKLYLVERMTFFDSLETFSQQAGNKGKMLFVNSIGTQWMSDEDEGVFTDRFRDLLPQIVVEFTESDYSPSMAMRKERTIRSWGACIAIDDFGSGMNSESVLLDFSSDYVKIDMGIVRGVDTSRDHRDIVRSLVTFAHERGILVIAEGVETEGELAVLIDLDVDFLQGYLTGRPAPALAGVDERARELIVKAARRFPQ